MFVRLARGGRDRAHSTTTAAIGPRAEGPLGVFRALSWPLSCKKRRRQNFSLAEDLLGEVGRQLAPPQNARRARARAPSRVPSETEEEEEEEEEAEEAEAEVVEEEEEKAEVHAQRGRACGRPPLSGRHLFQSSGTPRNGDAGLPAGKLPGGKAAPAIGQRIKVWWPLEQKWFHGEVMSYKPASRRHLVRYYDGDVEDLELSKEQWFPAPFPLSSGAAPPDHLAVASISAGGSERRARADSCLPAGSRIRVWCTASHRFLHASVQSAVAPSGALTAGIAPVLEVVYDSGQVSRVDLAQARWELLQRG
eukprot:jgi/Mesen1/2562/ME000162S01685